MTKNEHQELQHINSQTLTKLKELEESQLKEVFENNLFNKSLAYEDLELNVMPYDEKSLENIVTNNIEMFNITKLVYDKSEDTQEKLKMMYTSFYQYDLTTAIMLKRTNGKTNFYLLVKKNNSEHSAKAEKLVEGLLGGIFCGIETTRLKNGNESSQKTGLMVEIEQDFQAFSGLQLLPSAKNKQKNYIQGLEKIAHSINLDNFTMLLLAEPINKNRLAESKSFFEQAYTERSSLANISGSLNQSSSTGDEKTTTDTNSNTSTDSTSNEKTKGEDDEIKQAQAGTKALFQTLLPTVGATLGEMAGGFAGPVGLALGGVVGTSLGATLGSLVSGDKKNAKKTTSIIGESSTVGVSNSIAETLSNNLTKGQTINYTQENKAITNELQLIDREINRLNQGLSKGMWQYASYFFTENIEDAKLCTDITQGILLGEEMENIPPYSFSIDQEKSKENLKYAKKSVLSLNNLKSNNGMEFGLPITSNELAYGLPFPEKSFDNLTVLHLESFGVNPPNVPDKDNRVEIGTIHHMDKDLKNTVALDKNLFTSHVFVTGSTGSGKSNTINTILNNCSSIPYLIIEPTKGEYKNILGGGSDVHVFGTNHKKTDLLRINPFSFPESITLTEHMDKLVEIFNSAWAMYKTMPTILRSALEHAYESKGWIISRSQYIYEDKEYPDFNDLINSLHLIIKNSSFSDEVKENYRGSLVENVKELTKRFHKDIFVKDEITEDILFDSKCIIDLSSVGNLKTKSLITGFLFIKLQEYRMEQWENDIIQSNSKLKHITVLEEAHNLLPNINTHQRPQGNTSNKSIEVISDAIAEMRTYGEAFIIVDQSPEKVDSSAIKNTNTKIIHRLPDNEDCKIAGLSAGAKEQQLGQLATLKQGIAMIFQNGWAEPILCKIHKTNLKDQPYKYQPSHLSDPFNNPIKEQMVAIISKIKDINNISEKEHSQLNNLLSIIPTYQEALGIYDNDTTKVLAHLTHQLSCKLFDNTPLTTSISTNLKTAIVHSLNTTNPAQPFTSDQIIFKK